MFFKLLLKERRNILRKSILAVLASSLVLSCTPNSGEAPPENKLPALGATQCFGHAAQILKAFFQGDSNPRDLNQAWDCAKVAFETFHKYVRGSDKDKYTPRELASFIEKNFLEKDSAGVSAQIPDPLVAEFMKIKQLFIGGSQDEISRQEVLDTVVFIDEIRALTISLNPYMKILRKKWTPHSVQIKQEDLDFFEKGNQVVQESAKKFASLIKKNQPAYRFTNFVNIMTELSHFYGETWDFIGDLEKFLPVVGRVKVAVAGGNPNEIATNEWAGFTLLGSRGYMQFLRFYYFIKTAPESESGLKLAYIARTIEDTFSIFQDLVAIKPSQVITLGETQDMVMSLSEAWSDLKASEKLVNEFMKVKQVFFGGSRYYWSSGDFNTARLKVSKLKEILEKFLPYYSIYTKDWDRWTLPEDEARLQFQKAELNLVSALRELGGLFETSYSYDDFSGLIEEVDRLYNDSETEGASALAASGQWLHHIFDENSEDQNLNMSQNLKKYKNLFLDFKQIVFQDPQTVVQLQQWPATLSLGAKFYTTYLYYNYFLKTFDMDSASIQESVLKVSDSALNILQDFITVRAGAGIEYSEIGPLISHLKELEMIPSGLQVSTVQGVIKAAVENLFLDPQMRLVKNPQVPTNFGSVTISQIRQEIKVWMGPQLLLTRALDRNKTPEILPVDLIKMIADLKSKTNVPEFQVGLDDLSYAINSPYPMTTDHEGRLLISNKLTPTYSVRGVFWMNLSRTVSRLLIRGYSMDLNSIQNRTGLTRCEGRRAFLDLRNPFIDLNFLEVGSQFINSRITESNLFTPRGDGNKTVSSGELTDLVSMVVSGVLNDSKLKAHLRVECPIKVDAKTKKEFTTFGCMRKSYYKWLSQEMIGMPGYIDYVKSVYELEWRQGFVFLLRSAGWKPSGLGNMDDEKVILNDISLLPHITQYLEMLIVRFDKNKDQILSTYDVDRAFPLFKSLIKELAQDYINQGLIGEKDLRAVFTYLTRYGDTPKLSKIIRWWRWKDSPQKWDVWADRSMMAKILGFIADETDKSNSENAGKPDDCDKK